MSCNVYPNPGPLFPCAVCAWNVTWRGKSVYCCTCSKWVHLRCSRLSPNSELLAALTSGAVPCSVSACNPVTSTVAPHCNTVTSSLDASGSIPLLIYLAPPLLMQHSHPTLAFKPLIPPLPILFFLPLLPHPVSCSWLSFYASWFFFPPDFLQGSSMECWKSLGQELNWTTTLSFIPFCWPYLYPGI